MLLLSCSRKHYQIIFGLTTPLKTQATRCRTKYIQNIHCCLSKCVCLHNAMDITQTTPLCYVCKGEILKCALADTGTTS